MEMVPSWPRVAFLGVAVFAFSVGNSAAEERTYSVIEYLANQQQIGSEEARVKGAAMCYNEGECFVTGEGGRRAGFNSTDLPESDRIALIRSGAVSPEKEAVVTIKMNKATKVEFSK